MLTRIPFIWDPFNCIIHELTNNKQDSHHAMKHYILILFIFCPLFFFLFFLLFFSPLCTSLYLCWKIETKILVIILMDRVGRRTRSLSVSFLWTPYPYHPYEQLTYLVRVSVSSVILIEFHGLYCHIYLKQCMSLSCLFALGWVLKTDLPLGKAENHVEIIFMDTSPISFPISQSEIIVMEFQHQPAF